jgi:hypothetical protein
VAACQSLFAEGLLIGISKSIAARLLGGIRDHEKPAFYPPLAERRRCSWLDAEQVGNLLRRVPPVSISETWDIPIESL